MFGLNNNSDINEKNLRGCILSSLTINFAASVTDFLHRLAPVYPSARRAGAVRCAEGTAVILVSALYLAFLSSERSHHRCCCTSSLCPVRDA